MIQHFFFVVDKVFVGGEESSFVLKVDELQIAYFSDELFLWEFALSFSGGVDLL